MSRYGNYKSEIDFVPKLELKYIASYLPFGLKIKTNNLIREMVCDRMINDEDEYKLKLPIFNVITGIGHKPIMLPLSDLTKEIEHNGEKLVPIVEIIKKVSLIDLSDCFFDVYFEDGHYSVNAETANRSRVIDCIYFDGNVFSAINNGGDFNSLNPQLEAYEMLDQFHFDWKYDLIGKGLAIDKNTLI